MNAATAACALPGVTWDGINWAELQDRVRRLQARIVKATQMGRHNKVKALQWLLTHSFSGKALAVKRVTENKGKNTPGVDKVTWKTPQAKIAAIESLKRRGYAPLPLRRVMIPKKNGKMRPLGIPAMKCRAQQALYLLALEPIAETTADRNSRIPAATLNR
jgi:RNA-directed DNA polymerase